jgi:hypothetical protein
MLWLTLLKLRSSDSQVRLAAVQALATSNHPTAINALVVRLRDVNSVAWVSALGLAAKGDAQAVPVLIKISQAGIGGNLKEVAIQLIEQFAAMGNPQAVNFVEERQAIARIKAIIELTNGYNAQPSKAEVLSALKELTDLALIIESRWGPHRDSSYHRSYGDARGEVESHLLGMRGQDAEIMKLAATCLGRLLGKDEEQPLEALQKRVSDERGAPKHSVIQALAALGGKMAVDTAVAALLRYRPRHFDGGWYRLLSSIPDNRCAQLLLEELQRGSYQVSCYDALKTAVTNYPEKLSNDLLAKLIRLGNVTYREEYPDGGERAVPVDRRVVRELATKELRRRGQQVD